MMLLAIFVVPAYAQYRASLQGTVSDAQGGRVPGAQLTLTDKETNRVITATSDDSGNFNFNELSPSTYTLVVTRDGFKKKQYDGFRIIAEQSNALNVVLEVGGDTETVTVNAADTPIIDTATGSISGTLTQNAIAKLPSAGRDVYQLVQLAPGMFGDGAQASGGGSYSLPGSNSSGSGATAGVFTTENQPQSSGAGGRTNSNAISLDGVQITSVTWGGAAVITPNEDSIKEVKVSANPYDAEFGRSSGAQIQIISQNGTNTYHGSFFWKADRPGLNAYQRWDPNNNPQKNMSLFNEFGGSVGGPIWRNRIFGFFAYDTVRNSGVSIGGGWYDTSAFDSSAPSGSIASIFTTLDGAGVVANKVLESSGDNHECASINLIQGVNCNWIQGQGLDIGKPLTIGLGKQDPAFVAPYVDANNNTVYTPGTGGDGTGSYANLDGSPDLMYVSTQGPNNQTNVQYSGRLDVQATQNDLIAGTIYYVPVSSVAYSGTNGAVRASNIFYHNALNYSTGLLWNHTFNANLLSEARFDIAGWKWNELADNPQSPLGLPDAVYGVYSGGSNHDSFAYGSSGFPGWGPSIGSIFDQWTMNFKDVVTKVQGSHNMKFGGQFTKLAYLDAPTWDYEPTYYFNNMWDFLNDAPGAENLIADPRTGTPSYFRKDDRQNLYSFFFQDDWKMKPNLTLNLGLRWEYFEGMYEKAGNQANVRLGSGSNIFTDLNIQLGGNQVTPPKGNFGPQFGFAWSPANPAFNNRLVIRGGFGLGFDGLEQAITTNTRSNPPFLANSNGLYGDQILYAVGSDIYEAGTLPSNPNAITEFNSANLPVSFAVNVTGLPEHLPTAYVYRFSLQGQYDLGHQWVATVGYQGSLGRHLPVQLNLYNKYAADIIAGRIAFNPLVNFIDWYEDTGTSNYHALMLEARHQFSHTFEADFQYRWAKSLDEGSQPYAESDYQFAQGMNYGPSDYDSRHMFKAYGLWSPVIFHGQNNWLEKVVGGWSISGIFNFHTGFPFNPIWNNIGCNALYSGSGNCSLRATTYDGFAGKSQSTDTFKKNNGNFGTNDTGTTHFGVPVVPEGGAWDGTTAPTPATGLPSLPGVKRNSFYGPRYSDFDMTLIKAFGLPNMPILGENARFEIRGNAYNLFNKLNLGGVDNGIGDQYFGRAGTVLGSRTIELEAHFKF